MNLYHCMIDLRHDTKALVFAQALDEWMAWLADQGIIGSWRLFRRKLNLASDAHRDFLLEIEVEDLAQLDRLFSGQLSRSGDVEALYERVHQMIASLEFGLYRSYPDPTGIECTGIL